MRYYGHFEGDQQTYRGEGEVESVRASRDCLDQFRRRVTVAAILEDGELTAIDEQVAALIDEAVVEALAAPEPTLDDLLTDVYVSY